MYIPDKFVSRKCVFQKGILLYAKWREFIQRCYMEFIRNTSKKIDIMAFFICTWKYDSLIPGPCHGCFPDDSDPLKYIHT